MGNHTDPKIEKYQDIHDKLMEKLSVLIKECDEEIKKLGMDPNMGRGIMGEYGGLLNQRDEMKSQLKQDIIGGIESGAKYLGKSL